MLHLDSWFIVSGNLWSALLRVFPPIFYLTKNRLVSRRFSLPALVCNLFVKTLSNFSFGRSCPIQPKIYWCLWNIGNFYQMDFALCTWFSDFKWVRKLWELAVGQEEKLNWTFYTTLETRFSDNLSRWSPFKLNVFHYFLLKNSFSAATKTLCFMCPKCCTFLKC